MILSIIIPVFNEEKTIKGVLKKVINVKLPNGIKKQIIVVDDGSTDNSKLITQNLKLKNIKLIVHKKNMGKGAAIKSGLKVVRGDYVIIQDADLEYNPDDYLTLLKPVINHKITAVFGTRLKDYPLNFWGKNKTVLPTHLIANKFLTTLTNILYGSKLTDMETGYKLINADILKKIKLKSNKFDFEPEITAKILEMKIPIVEVAIKANPRTYEEGKKIGWRDGLIAIWTLIKYRFVE